ncbi:uncharacterized protein LOC110692129 [Chenopodium quinoa]|uniref:uncharacterized protein LOC110692129 n=1 Tax=Chenopodium quinoa TaxID=63459 RepID=UPI000B797E07|nr:uncharacterized protein LOC110692129 [Chenopodium quinoa]
MVRARGVVVKTQSRTTQKAPNLNGVKAFGSIVHTFDDSRKKVVTEMGFGGLLKIPLTYLPRKFAYWLLTRVDGEGSLVFGDQYVVPLSPVQVEYVLRISMGSQEIPARIPADNEEMQTEARRIVQRYSKAGGENISLSLSSCRVSHSN